MKTTFFSMVGFWEPNNRVFEGKSLPVLKRRVGRDTTAVLGVDPSLTLDDPMEGFRGAMDFFDGNEWEEDGLDELALFFSPFPVAVGRRFPFFTACIAAVMKANDCPGFTDLNGTMRTDVPRGPADRDFFAEDALLSIGLPWKF